MRRNRLDLVTPEELAIYNAMAAVEKIPACDTLLTECVVLLAKAKDKLADWVERDMEEDKKRGE